jgi:NTE family protein
MRVGLCLGAGGVVGASWLIGALEALEAEAGWDATTAEAIVGTSAGSAIGALCAEGLSAHYMTAYLSGTEVDDIVATAQQAGEAQERIEQIVRAAKQAEEAGEERPNGIGYQLERALPPLGPGSWRLAVESVLHPRRHAPTTLLTGWLPRGFISTEPIKRLVEAFIPGDWPDHPSFWAVAADYADGRRVPFGRPGEPRARVADAVAASCAIPAFYHPQTIQGRRYVDGGICSPSNVDLLAHHELDLIVCLNPMSSLAQVTGGSAGDRVGALMRAFGRRRLDHELAKVRALGTEVLCLEPTSDDVKIMGLNMMSSARRTEVADVARETTARTLRALRAEGHTLPGRRGRHRAGARAENAA